VLQCNLTGGKDRQAAQMAVSGRCLLTHSLADKPRRLERKIDYERTQ
jgi:hypothetical protein